MNFVKRLYDQVNNASPAVIEMERVWTMMEFSQYVTFVNNELLNQNVQRIMIVVPQGFFGYVLIWGAYTAGVTFCPVHHEIPADRIRYIANQFRPDIIITSKEMSLDGWEIVVNQDFFKHFRSDIPRKEVGYDKHSLAYVIFTSGSTGLPKGVMVNRASLDHFLKWSTNQYGLKEGDRFGQYSDLGFDLSICDVFTSIICGATIIPIASFGEKVSPGRIIRSRKITFWHSVPSVIDFMNKANQINYSTIGSIRIMSFCGEPLFPAQLQLLFDANPNLVVYNTYGPTETTIFCTAIRLTSKNYKRYCKTTVSIGRPMPGYKIEPKGETGELLIVSKYIGTGYLDDVWSNVSSYSSREVNGKSIPCFASGDYGEYFKNNLYFIGRKDTQIKIYGKRIDLKEIDFQLRELGCKISVTIYESKMITSFISPIRKSEGKIRTLLQSKLPNYYQPHAIIKLAEFPYTKNNKIDINKLRGLIRK